MKPDVSDIDAGSDRHSERLNSTVEVLVIERVLIVPDTGGRVGHFVPHEPDAVGAWSRFDLVYSCASPDCDGWLHSHCRSIFIETEAGRTAYSVFTVGSVVVHVAFPRMRLAPCILMRRDILTFHKIDRSRVERRVQITDLNPDTVRYSVVIMAGMVIRNVPAGEGPREGVYPGARPKTGLTRV